MVETVPAHENRETQAGENSMFVGISHADATTSSLEDRWEALKSHVQQENENVEIEIVARQFHRYTRTDGYVYKIWYKRKI